MRSPRGPSYAESSPCAMVAFTYAYRSCGTTSLRLSNRPSLRLEPKILVQTAVTAAPAIL